MKRFTGLLLIIILMVTGSAFAQSDNHSVTAAVQAVSRVDVDVNVSITVDDTDGDDLYDLPASDNSATLAYAHNGAAAKKITILATEFSVGSNDMDIEASDGTTTVDLVTNGVVMGAAADFITGINRGSDSKTLTYRVTGGTMAGTPTGNYVYTLTYTLTN